MACLCEELLGDASEHAGNAAKRRTLVLLNGEGFFYAVFNEENFSTSTFLHSRSRDHAWPSARAAWSFAPDDPPTTPFTSPMVGCAASSGSTTLLALHTSLAAAVCRFGWASARRAPYPHRSGSSMVPWVSRDLTAQAPDIRTWLVSHAQNVRFHAAVL